MRGAPSPSSRGPLLILGAGTVTAAAYLQLAPSFAAETVRVFAPLVALGLVLLGVVTKRFERPAPWGFVGASMFSLLLAHLAWAALWFDGSPTFPSVVDVFMLLATLGLVVAVVLFARGQGEERDSLGPVDSLIITLAVGLVLWLALIEPYLATNTLLFGERAWGFGVPLLGAIGLAVALRLAANHGFRELGSMLLLAGVGFRLASDISRYLLEPRDQYEPATFAAALGIIAPFALAAAVAAGDHTALPEDERASLQVSASFGRVVGLSVAVLTPLTVLLAMNLAGAGTSLTRTVSAGAGIVVVILALARMWALISLVRNLEERKHEDRLTAIVEHSTDVVVLVDPDAMIRYASPSMTSTLSHRAEDWINRPVLDLVSWSDREETLSCLREVLEAGMGSTAQFDTTLVRADGHQRRVAATIVNQVGGEAVDGLVITFRDVTDERDLQDELSRKAFNDELTGLANRALFLDSVDGALRKAARSSEAVVVLFLDLDDFKSVNDQLGHAAGDQMLRTIADQIRANTGPGDVPARLGGDEFAVLLSTSGGVERGLAVGEALLASLREPMNLAEFEVIAMASVGVAVAEPGMTTSELLRDADVAMYEAKRAGKGQVKVFDPAMRLGATQHLTMRGELAAAIANGDLRPAFQPMVDLRTGEVVGAEALARWYHPERGSIPPSEFVPVAERAGLIGEMGAAVLAHAIAYCTEWQQGRKRFVSVNVSAGQLRNNGFVDTVKRTLASVGLPPECLWIEVTETMLVEEIEATSETLQALRDLGVVVAIDDFGTGYCSLSYLQKFPVDVLKIDRQFVVELGASQKDRTLAQMILQMTDALGITSVAEGIEDPEQLKALRGFGCDIGQGFLLSRPMDADEFAQRLGASPAPQAPVRAVS